MSEGNSQKFDDQAPDRIAMVVKSGVNLIPILGPALSEIVTSVIPNQKLDRVIAYLELIAKHLGEEKLEEIKKLPERIALIEEGVYAAGFTTQKSKLKRLAYVVINGLNKEEIENDYQVKLMDIVKQLSELDVLVLELHAKRTQGDRENFFKMHQQTFGSNKYNYSRRYLSSLLLLEQKFVAQGTDRSISLNDFFKQVQEPTNYAVTDLGREVSAAIKQPEVIEKPNAP
jgi:hypothetical protein